MRERASAEAEAIQIRSFLPHRRANTLIACALERAEREAISLGQAMAEARDLAYRATARAEPLPSGYRNPPDWVRGTRLLDRPELDLNRLIARRKAARSFGTGAAAATRKMASALGSVVAAFQAASFSAAEVARAFAKLGGAPTETPKIEGCEPLFVDDADE